MSCALGEVVTPNFFLQKNVFLRPPLAFKKRSISTIEGAILSQTHHFWKRANLQTTQKYFIWLKKTQTRHEGVMCAWRGRHVQRLWKKHVLLRPLLACKKKHTFKRRGWKFEPSPPFLKKSNFSKYAKIFNLSEKNVKSSYRCPVPLNSWRARHVQLLCKKASFYTLI